MVAVIGGGSVAMDCVESALKLGARDAFLVYRRSFAQMPAEEDERLAALRRGVHFLVLNQPVGYLADGKGRVKGLKLVRTGLAEPDHFGRRRPGPSRDRSGRWMPMWSWRRSETAPTRPTGRPSSRWMGQALSWRTGRRVAPRPPRLRRR